MSSSPAVPPASSEDACRPAREAWEMPKRLHYIDWLRVLAVLLLFPFHTSRVFNYDDPFYIKSAELSQALNYTLGFIDRWHMPLLFLLAGASTYLALGKRSGREYAVERVMRLLVPLVFGIFVIIPPQTWVGAQYNSGYTGSYVEYITSGDFLVFNFGPGGDYYGGFGIGQLWFILFLLLMALILLPVLLWGRGERGSRRIGSLARRLARPAWWLLPPVVLWFAEGLPDVAGKNWFYFSIYFLLGFVVIADGRFAEAAERHRWAGLAIGTTICATYVASWSVRAGLPDPSLELVAVNIVGMFGIWTMLIGMLGAGKHYLDRTSPALAYLAEASYPVYILHQTVIVLAAFWLVRLPVGLPAQWIAVFVTAVVVTFGVYELVRRFGLLRFLFGMRPKRAMPQVTPPKLTPAAPVH
jgi:peptidoglycan/LPS O-acetylase OafA/YrhL